MADLSLTRLLPEVFEMIMSNLSSNDLHDLRQTCRALRRAVAQRPRDAIAQRVWRRGPRFSRFPSVPPEGGEGPRPPNPLSVRRGWHYQWVAELEAHRDDILAAHNMVVGPETRLRLFTLGEPTTELRRLTTHWADPPPLGTLAPQTRDLVIAKGGVIDMAGLAGNTRVRTVWFEPNKFLRPEEDPLKVRPHGFPPGQASVRRLMSRGGVVRLGPASDLENLVNLEVLDGTFNIQMPLVNPSLRRLRLQHSANGTTMEAPPRGVSWPALEEFDVSHLGVLPTFSRMPALRTFRMRPGSHLFVPCTLDGGSRNLRRLELRSTRPGPTITFAAPRPPLPAFEALTDIHLDSARVDVTALAQAAPAVRAFRVTATSIVGASHIFEGCPQLTSVRLQQLGQAAAGSFDLDVRNCVAHPDLTELWLEAGPNQSLRLEGDLLQAMGNLRALHLSTFHTVDSMVGGAALLPRLELLHLDNVQTMPVIPKALRRIAHLTRVVPSAANLECASACALVSLAAWNRWTDPFLADPPVPTTRLLHLNVHGPSGCMFSGDNDAVIENKDRLQISLHGYSEFVAFPTLRNIKTLVVTGATPSTLNGLVLEAVEEVYIDSVPPNYDDESYNFGSWTTVSKVHIRTRPPDAYFLGISHLPLFICGDAVYVRGLYERPPTKEERAFDWAWADLARLEPLTVYGDDGGG